MFRLTQFMQAIRSPNSVRPLRKPRGPVVIWNLIRRCNLTCKHCYSISADTHFPGELTTQQVFDTMDDLRDFGVPALILSGGEPLLRDDIYVIAERAKAQGFYVGLSTNGTLIDTAHAQRIQATQFDYVGISIDGIGATHDHFRQLEGAFDKSINAVRLCREQGVKVGLRFTLTQDNARELPQLLELLQREQIDKFYLSHLNYAGRGNRNRKDDVIHQTTRWAMDLLFEYCWRQLEQDRPVEIVTGNNDADGVYLLHWCREHVPNQAEFLQQRLQQWGGNASGVNVANIDNLGQVHPDTFWWNYTLGNVKERPFSQIWNDRSDPLMDGFKQNPRPLKGRCGACAFQNICNGNTRVRAYQLSGDPWQEDPACYLYDEEIGISSAQPRLQLTPYRRKHRVGA